MGNIMTVRAPDDVREALKEIAAAQGYTRNALILQILREWLESRRAAERGRG